MNLACFHQIIVWWKILKTIVWRGVAELLASSKSQTVGVGTETWGGNFAFVVLGILNPLNHFFSSSWKTPLLSILQQRPCSKSEYKFWALVYQLCQIILTRTLIELRLFCTFVWILPCPFQHLALSIYHLLLPQSELCPLRFTCESFNRTSPCWSFRDHKSRALIQWNWTPYSKKIHPGAHSNVEPCRKKKLSAVKGEFPSEFHQAGILTLNFPVSRSERK